MSLEVCSNESLLIERNIILVCLSPCYGVLYMYILGDSVFVCNSLISFVFQRIGVCNFTNRTEQRDGGYGKPLLLLKLLLYYIIVLCVCSNVPSVFTTVVLRLFDYSAQSVLLTLEMWIPSVYPCGTLEHWNKGSQP